MPPCGNYFFNINDLYSALKEYLSRKQEKLDLDLIGEPSHIFTKVLQLGKYT